MNLRCLTVVAVLGATPASAQLYNPYQYQPYQPPTTYNTYPLGNNLYTNDNHGNSWTTYGLGNNVYTQGSNGSMCSSYRLGANVYTNCQ